MWQWVPWAPQLHPSLPQASLLVPSLPRAEAPGACPVCKGFTRFTHSFILEHAFSLLITLLVSFWAANNTLDYLHLQRGLLPPLHGPAFTQLHKKKKKKTVPKSGSSLLRSRSRQGGRAPISPWGPGFLERRKSGLLLIHSFIHLFFSVGLYWMPIMRQAGVLSILWKQTCGLVPLYRPKGEMKTVGNAAKKGLYKRTKSLSLFFFFFWMPWSSNSLRISELEKFSELGSFLYFRNFGRQCIMWLKCSSQDTGPAVCHANSMGGTCWVVQCTPFSAVHGSPDADRTEVEFSFYHLLFVNQHLFL